jgi:hypothetical protein
MTIAINVAMMQVQAIDNQGELNEEQTAAIYLQAKGKARA